MNNEIIKCYLKMYDYFYEHCNDCLIFSGNVSKTKGFIPLTPKLYSSLKFNI